MATAEYDARVSPADQPLRSGARPGVPASPARRAPTPASTPNAASTARPSKKAKGAAGLGGRAESFGDPAELRAAFGGRPIGPHLQLAPGLLKAADRAILIGAGTVQVFADNPT